MRTQLEEACRLNLWEMLKLYSLNKAMIGVLVRESPTHGLILFSTMHSVA